MKRLALLTTALILIACSDAQSPETTAPIETVAAPGAYMIVSGRDYDAKDLGAYAAALPPIYARYGGKYVALSTDYDVAEGEIDATAIIISAWPDAAAARAFWDGPEYREAIKLREGIGKFDVVIVPALPQR